MMTERIGFSGYLIQKRAFKNTAVIATFFTEKGELISGIIHGGQKKQLAIFQPFYGQIYLRDGLSLFDKLETNELAKSLTGSLLFCGLYANELLGRLGSGLHDSPAAFNAYEALLNEITERNKENCLRRFENILLTQLGYELDFSCDIKGNPIQNKLDYVFLADMGCRIATVDEVNCADVFLIKGSDLLALQDETNLASNLMKLRKKINRYRINFLLDGKELISRQLFS